ncbi:Mechanosensitive ion channel protein [Mycena kentingensis (nom. inval.)]|nr:Mechanosensitive ion channel protein [Mycena kentingensis (nom. inval.)]
MATSFGQYDYDPVQLHPVQPPPAGQQQHSYPPSMAIPLNNMPSPSGMRPYDPERATPIRPEMQQHTSSGSWDLLGGKHSYAQFDPAAGAEHLKVADNGNNEVTKLYYYLLNVSIVTRWFIFIVPVLGIIWIPGILDYTGTVGDPKRYIWGVRFKWWSIWLSVVWGGWWACLAVSQILPPLVRKTLGVIAVGTRRYLDWLAVLHRYTALFLWTMAVFISYNPLINSRQVDNATQSSIKIIDLGQKLFFAFFLCAALLLFEKFSIQFIAGKFHERSYAERIADQAFAVRSVVTLYTHSKNVGRPDTLRTESTKELINPTKFLKRALKGVRNVATTTTTAFGNVASEIAGTSPTSCKAAIFSFAKPGADYMLVEDINKFFASPEEADQVFALFDKDSNGDATLDEVEMAFHREQLSIEHSMQDLDSAVGRLDNIFMWVSVSAIYSDPHVLKVVIAILIIAVSLEAQVATLVTSAGTLVLGLSWLIGGTLAEVLTSIIFLFIKHPFDVGDRIAVEGGVYTVKEASLSISILTIFINSEGVSVQAPNTHLNGQDVSKFIQNYRRSPQMSEAFTFDVDYSTSFEDLQKLRERMLTFLVRERRDYQPAFDVVVVDFPEQSKMTLSADIKYKSNGQQGALKAKRRNKWLCELKAALAELGIYGPDGKPDKPAEPAAPEPEGGWRLSGKNAVILDGGDIFSDPDDLNRTIPRPQNSSASGSTLSMPTANVPPRM